MSRSAAYRAGNASCPKTIDFSQRIYYNKVIEKGWKDAGAGEQD
ncbi:hypothetical protein [Blautia argi]|nr:hypothetical protein [Blautia argi]